MNISVNIGALKLKNPITVASGTFGYGEEFNEDLYPIKNLGAVFAKGVSLKPREGNPMPRLVETASGMINAIGLANVGLEKFINEKIPYLKKSGATVVVNIFGESIADYAEIAERLNDVDGVHGIELNISCPNVKCGGIYFGTDPKEASKVTKAVRKKTKLPLIVKLSPNVTDITEIGVAVESAGASAVSAINTITAMAIDIKKRRPVLANVIGGLSGPAIKPVALRMVWQLAKKLKIPVIGIGGISSIKDVIEFLIAGATAVQIGTANFVDPQFAANAITQLESFLKEEKISDINQIIGSVHHVSSPPLYRVRLPAGRHGR